MLGKNYTYQYGKADGLDGEDLLPVILVRGTPRQQRQARRLLRTGEVAGKGFLLGLVSFGATGLFGPRAEPLRYAVGWTGVGLVNASIISVPLRSLRVRRLIRAYNEAQLAQALDGLPPGAANRYTLADTVAWEKGAYQYRELLGVLPNQTPGFSLTEPPSPIGVGGVLAVGLATVGSLAMAGSAAAALGPGDYRRLAWTGWGATGVGFGVAILIGQGNGRRYGQQLESRIRQYNQFVREQSSR